MNLLKEHQWAFSVWEAKNSGSIPTIPLKQNGFQWDLLECEVGQFWTFTNFLTLTEFGLGKKDTENPSGYFENDKRAPAGFFGMRGKKHPSGFFGMRGKKYPYEFRGKFVGVRYFHPSSCVIEIFDFCF